jgi:cell division protein FtsB
MMDTTWKGRLSWVGAIVALILLGIAAGREWMRSASLGQEIAALEEERARLTEQVADLESLTAYAESDAFVEEQARESFGLAKPGESVAVIPFTPTVAPAPAPAMPRWKEWLQWLAGEV